MNYWIEENHLYFLIFFYEKEYKTNAYCIGINNIHITITMVSFRTCLNIFVYE